MLYARNALIDRYAETAQDPDPSWAALYLPSVYVVDHQRLNAHTSRHRMVPKDARPDQSTQHSRPSIFDLSRFRRTATVPCC